MQTKQCFEHNAVPGSLELAYMGDTIYDLYVRRYLVKRGGRVMQMHKDAVALVCNHAQAEALTRIEPLLDDEEQGVVRRARKQKITVLYWNYICNFHRQF